MSKRRSASKTRRTAQPEPVFFVDRCLGGKKVPDALRAAGLNVIAQDTIAGHDESDPTLLRMAGKNGWAFVTKDRLRESPVEIETLKAAGVRAFIVRRNKLDGESLTGETLGILIAGYAKAMVRACKTREGPFVAVIGSRGMRFDADIELERRRAKKSEARKQRAAKAAKRRAAKLAETRASTTVSSSRTAASARSISTPHLFCSGCWDVFVRPSPDGA